MSFCLSIQKLKDAREDIERILDMLSILLTNLLCGSSLCLADCGFSRNYFSEFGKLANFDRVGCPVSGLGVYKRLCSISLALCAPFVVSVLSTFGFFRRW